MTNWEMRFKNETGGCPYKDIQQFADWLQREMSKLTSDNSDYAKSCKNCKHESYPECPAHGDRYPWNWDPKSDYCGRHDFA
jgi:hypothetical protein